MINNHPAEHSPLGKSNRYIDKYTPSLLYPISRAHKWADFGFNSEHLPYYGVDIWNSYEFSWLTPSGKPEVRLVEFVIPADSPFIIESKSFKLYLNSFNQTVFLSESEVQKILQQDLSQVVGKLVQVSLFAIDNYSVYQVRKIKGICIDHINVTVAQYEHPSASLLTLREKPANEIVYSHLLKSNCPVTNQPDWGTLIIDYESDYTLNYEGLLQYIISFRCHADFHEQCVERIFVDLLNKLKPKKLIVMARYVRRGGLDINPCRSLQITDYSNLRLVRQ